MKDPLKKFYRREGLRKKIFWLDRAISRIQPPEEKYIEMNIAAQLNPMVPGFLTIGVTIYWNDLCIGKIFMTRTIYKYLKFDNQERDRGWQLVGEGKTEDIVL